MFTFRYGETYQVQAEEVKSNEQDFQEDIHTESYYLQSSSVDGDEVEVEHQEEVMVVDDKTHLKMIKIQETHAHGISEEEEEEDGTIVTSAVSDDEIQDVDEEIDVSELKTRKIAVIRIVNEDGSTDIIHQEVTEDDDDEDIPRSETIFIENEEDDEYDEMDDEEDRTEEEEEEIDEDDDTMEDADFGEDPDDPDFEVDLGSAKISKRRKRKSVDDNKCPLCPKSFNLEAVSSFINSVECVFS